MWIILNKAQFITHTQCVWITLKHQAEAELQPHNKQGTVMWIIFT